MVSSESILDIFKSESAEHKCGTSSLSNDVSCESSNGSEVKICDLENDRLTSGTSDSKNVECEKQDSLSWRLHLSEEVNDTHCLEVSQSSEETHLSFHTSFSFEDSKDNILNGETVCSVKPKTITPDLFAESQAISPKETNVYTKSKSKNEIDDFENRTSSREEYLQEESSGSSSQISTSLISDISSMPEEGHSSLDFQSLQESFADSPGPEVIPQDPQDSQLDCRERQESWDTQELKRVSERLALRRKQARRLILTVIRKRQMAQETLDAFKKRLKRF